jgi:hypothetical protein
MESKAIPVEARAICSPQPIRFLENVTNQDHPLLLRSKNPSSNTLVEFNEK